MISISSQFLQRILDGENATNLVVYVTNRCIVSLILYNDRCFIIWLNLQSHELKGRTKRNELPNIKKTCPQTHQRNSLQSLTTNWFSSSLLQLGGSRKQSKVLLAFLIRFFLQLPIIQNLHALQSWLDVVGREMRVGRTEFDRIEQHMILNLTYIWFCLEQIEIL